MRRILASIGAALRAAFRMLRALARLPGQIMGSLLGFAPDVDDSPQPAPFEDPDGDGGPELDRQEYYGLVADYVLSWCADCLIYDKRAPLPAPLPVEVGWWLPGLTRGEAEIIINQSCDRVSLHLQGIREIPGVRPVQALTPVSWRASRGAEPANAVAMVTCEPSRSDEPAPPSILRAG